MRRPHRNRSGQVYSLTTLTPVVPERANALARSLNALPGRDASPLARVPGTHFARWVLLDDVVNEGPPQKRDHLSAPRLLFTSNFDGDLAQYLEGLRTGLGATANDIWGHCVGYPGHEAAADWSSWFRAHQVDSTLFFAAYVEMTVERVHACLDARVKLRQFALDSRGTPAAELKASFLETFAE